MFNKKIIIFVILSAIFFLEVLSFYIGINYKKKPLKNNYELSIETMRVKQEQEKKKLHDEFEKNKFLATGKDVYERIYNKHDASIIDLLAGLSREAFPEDWKYEVAIEEFTNFILLVQVGVAYDRPDITEVIKYIIPVITYASPYVKNVAIFDKRHKCYLFFDENVLDKLRETQSLSKDMIAEAISGGRIFTRYNSIKIDFEKENGHIYVPVIVSGEHGIFECYMMLDTGASMSVISLELAQKTGHEDLNNCEKRTFSTANGLMDCVILRRKISVGSIDKEQLVAVNLHDNTHLLGVDFFKGKDYMIDAMSNSIYVWSQ